MTFRHTDDDTSGLPWSCYGTHPTDGTLIIMKRGSIGYWEAEGYAMGACDTWSAVANLLNDSRGVTRAQRAAMESGSMFGFDTAAADPSRYDDQGEFIRPRKAAT